MQRVFVCGSNICMLAFVAAQSRGNFGVKTVFKIESERERERETNRAASNMEVQAWAARLVFFALRPCLRNHITLARCYVSTSSWSQKRLQAVLEEDAGAYACHR